MATATTHECPGGCERQVAQHLLACPDDWFRLPREMRAAINRAWRLGALGRAEHVRLLRDAAAWYRANPQRPVQRQR